MEDYKKEIEKIKGIGAKKFNNFWLGVFIGLAIPMLFLFIYWLWSFRFMGFIPGFFRYLVLMKILAPTLSLCVVPNLGMFFLFLNQERYKSGRGIILAAFIYGGIIMYLKMYVENTMFG
ncbi:MAG: hypothetical protein K0S33_3347 [Bacteroidetes bacterium]|nr:hypothetical protein [Bacteroidota bacterium]